MPSTTATSALHLSKENPIIRVATYAIPILFTFIFVPFSFSSNYLIPHSGATGRNSRAWNLSAGEWLPPIRRVRKRIPKTALRGKAVLGAFG